MVYKILQRKLEINITRFEWKLNCYSHNKEICRLGMGLGLWCLTPLSTIF
jgi:hypothetical protein